MKLPVHARIVAAWYISVALFCPPRVFAQPALQLNQSEKIGLIIGACFFLVVLVAMGIHLWKEHQENQQIKAWRAEWDKRDDPPATTPVRTDALSSAAIRQGEPWTPEEDTTLAELVRAHVALPEIATQHQRSPHAIARRLAKLREAGTLPG